jgi:hypothetical protein
MSMKNALLAGVAGTFVAGAAMAAEPVTLSDTQMDQVTAGLLSASFGVGLQGPAAVLGFGDNQLVQLNQTAIVESFSAGTTAGTQGTYQTQGAVGNSFLGAGGNTGIAFIGTSFGVGGTLDLF